MANIIVAVNAIFVVRSDLREAFLSAFQRQVEPLKQQHSARPSLLQAVLGEDLETPATFHCHFKFQCSSLDEAKDALKDHAVFLNGPCDIWNDLEADNPFQEAPKTSVWTIAESQSTVDAPNPKLLSSNQPVFCLNADLHIQPEHREEFLLIMENARSNSIKEELCIEYQYGESIEIPNTFHVHQEYIGDDGGKEGFDLHAETPQYQLWNEFSKKEPFTKEPMGHSFRSLVTSFAGRSFPHHSTLLLDGGNGHELKQRGITDGSFLAGLLANERQPEIVKSVHRNFCNSGCRILTTNNFVAVPQRIQKDILGDDADPEAVRQRTKELITAAVQCSKEAAKEQSERHVQVAGTVPPLTDCYMASLVPEDLNEMVSDYTFLLSTLMEEGVDILLAETLSTTREAIAILTAWAELISSGKATTNKPSQPTPLLAISFTIDDFASPTALRSGERLDSAVKSVLQESKRLGVKLWAIGVNCASPVAVSNAIPSITTVLKKSDLVPPPRIIAYANAFRTTTSEWLASVVDGTSGKDDDATNQLPIHSSLNEEYDSQGLILPDVYARYAKACQDAGVSVVGGCCGCSPAHQKAIAKRLGLT